MPLFVPLAGVDSSTQHTPQQRRSRARAPHDKETTLHTIRPTPFAFIGTEAEG